MVTPRKTERKEFLPNSASLTLLWMFQWARYFDRFCLARIFLLSLRGVFSIIVQTHSKVIDEFFDLLAFSEYRKFEIIMKII